ncbi:MAG: hypothetical protein ACFB10_17505 [Salibacteraceae bacterium]
MKNWPFLLLATGLVLTACKDDDEPIACEPDPEYTPGKTGSYWVYEVSSTNAQGEVTLQNYVDSIYLDEDSVINGQSYRVERGTYFNAPYLSLLRKENQQLIAEDGAVAFTPVISNDTFSTFYDASIQTNFYAQMVDPGFEWETPAGTFDVIAKRTTIITAFPVSWSNPQFQYIFWADGIGIVGDESFFFSNADTKIRRRLLRYQLVE